MKNKFNPLPFLLSLWLAVLAIPLAPGCSSPQKAAFTTTSTIAVSVDAAMTAWGDYVKQFNPAMADRQKVADAFAKYQAAELLLIDSEQALFATNTTATSSGVSTAQTQLDQAIADLVTLIQSFGVKLQ